VVAVLLVAASIKTIGLQALTNGNFFGKAKVTKSNIYRYLNNPIYDGYFLLFIALGLLYGNAVFYVLALQSFIGLNLIETYFERP
jgi:protein-S-isoprenylcysteine O-methyltransferase Ste14